MPDIRQKKLDYPRYRYSIPQLLELSDTAWVPFDLSKFTYEAARAGVVPPLENCAMSSRKSSASSTLPVSTGTASTADLILFRGNHVQHPGRQPQLPPPIERQKDEGFVRFLKKHSSPTHNRVTAGGRIVPMEPRSPPIFTLPSVVTNRPQAVSGDHDLQNIRTSGQATRAQMLQNYQQYDDTSTEGELAANRVPPNQHMNDFVNNALPSLFPPPPTLGLAQVPMEADQVTSVALTPGRAFLPGQHVGGPVVPYPVQHNALVYNAFQSPPAVTSTMPLANGFCHSPTWPMYEQTYVPHDPMPHLTSAFESLAAWEQHFVDLDSQLKNIDRYRAMHHLDPYLAEQRKEIVQQRSDAKDTVREFQVMLGVRRTLDSSQDSFATGFNVDAPAYVPSRQFESTDSMPRDRSTGPASRSPITEKMKVTPGRRAIPIVAPSKQNHGPVKTRREGERETNSRAMTGVDEWGVQNRSAPPEIQREQSRLSDMLQAEHSRLSANQDNSSQYTNGSQLSDQSGRPVQTESIPDSTEANLAKASVPEVGIACQAIPRNSADEIQQVMDAIGKPKGTVTQVCLLDSRVINVEGQGLNLFSGSQQQRFGHDDWSEAAKQPLVPQAARSTSPRITPKHVMDVDQTLMIDPATGKENALVAPKGHQKAATDAFLAQYNAIEDNGGLTAKPETRSLRTISNRLVDEHKYSGNWSGSAVPLPMTDGVTERKTVSDFSSQQGTSTYVVASHNSTFTHAALSPSPEDLNNKSYSSISVQNINAVGRLPQTQSSSAEAQIQLVAAEKATSPRLLRRNGVNGGAWYGPYCREVFQRVRTQGNTSRSTKQRIP